MAKIYEYIVRIKEQGSAALKKYGAAFGVAEKGTARADRSARLYNNTVNRVSGSLRLLKNIAVTVFAGAMLQGIIQTTAKAQSLENAIRFASGTIQEGDTNMKFLDETANRLGLSLEASQEGFKVLSGAMIGSKLQGEATRDIFESVSIGASAMGLTAEQTEGAFLALGQMMGKGKVQAEELRGQLGERIPGAFQIAARAMGVTTSALDKMMADGKLVAEDFLPKFAAEMKKTFSGALPKSVNSLQANLNRFNNRIYEGKIALGNALLPTINKVLGGFSNLFGFVKTNQDALQRVFAPIKNMFQPILNVFDRLSERFGFASGQGSMLESVFNGIGSTLKFIEPLLVTIGELVGVVVEKVINIGAALADNKYFRGFVGGFIDMLTTIGQAAKNILGGIGDLITGILSGDFGAIKEGFKSIGKGIIEGNPLAVGKAGVSGFSRGMNTEATNFFGAKTPEEAGVAGGVGAGGSTPGAPPKDAASSSAKAGVSAIAGGGKQSLNINFENVELVGQKGTFSGGVTENKVDLENTLKELLARILNGAIYTARQ